MITRAESLVYIEGGSGSETLLDLLYRSLYSNYLVPNFAEVLKCLVAERGSARRSINLSKAFGAEFAGKMLINWHEGTCKLGVLK